MALFIKLSSVTWKLLLIYSIISSSLQFIYNHAFMIKFLYILDTEIINYSRLIVYEYEIGGALNFK